MDGLLGLILLTQVTSTTYDHAQSNQHAQDFIRISRLAQGVSTTTDREIFCYIRLLGIERSHAKMMRLGLR